MRIVLSLLLVASLLPQARAETNEEAVKALRGAISAKRTRDRDKLLEEFWKRGDITWPSVLKALTEGPYYQKPMVTQTGERGSGKHYGIRCQGEDNKMRGFSLYVPKSYNPKKGKSPVLVYLHHGSASVRTPNQGAERAGVAMFRFRKVCEENGVFLLAPYTCQGAEWWTPEGKRLVEWCLDQLKRRFRVDENRIGLMGALDGGDAVWHLGQEMPGTFSSLLPMTGDPYEMTAIVQPLCLGTLDRMDILVGVAGRTRSTIGEKNALQFLQGLKPMVDQRMRITTAIYPRSNGDFGYLEQIRDRAVSFVMHKKRKPLALEVDVETTRKDGLRSLWLENHGPDKDGDVAHNFKSTVLHWKAPKRKEQQKKLGIGIRANNWDVGVTITSVAAGALDANLINGDVILKINGQKMRTQDDIKKAIQSVEWNGEAHLVLAREVKESDLAREQKTQADYLKIRAKIKELRAAGKPIPRNHNDLIDDEDEACGCDDDDDDEGGIEIEMGGDDEDEGKIKKGKTEGTKIFVFERWVKIHRPGGPIIRTDFGAGQARGFRHEGVKVAWVFPGSLAARSGLKANDVIVQVGDTQVKSIHDLNDWFKEFKFHDEPEDKRWVELTVRTDKGEGQFGDDRTIRLEWVKPLASRVDARWDKKENTLHVLARKSKGFTVYFTDKMILPGKEFHLFINGVPYQDCVDPAKIPEYPKITAGSDALERDRLYRMRLRRSKIKGWKPDVKLAIEDYVKHRDGELVIGGKMSFDLAKMKAGMKAYRAAIKAPAGNDKGKRVKKALEDYLAKG